MWNRCWIPAVAAAWLQQLNTSSQAICHADRLQRQSTDQGSKPIRDRIAVRHEIFEHAKGCNMCSKCSKKKQSNLVYASSIQHLTQNLKTYFAQINHIFRKSSFTLRSSSTGWIKTKYNEARGLKAEQTDVLFKWDCFFSYLWKRLAQRKSHKHTYNNKTNSCFVASFWRICLCLFLLSYFCND